MDENTELGWLIRDTSNVIRGPFRYNEVLQLIKKGQLKGKTEISRANSYWFAIEEKVEVARFFPELNGGRPIEQPTQMTATLAHTENEERGVEVTQFTSMPSRSELANQEKEGGTTQVSSGEAQMQWLSDEMAEEFGSDLSSISLVTNTDALSNSESEPQIGRELPEEPNSDATSTSRSQTAETEKNRQNEMLKRATVKADTLPSEHKAFQGERPKPINNLIRGPGRASHAASALASAGVVSVPVETPDSAATILDEEDEDNFRAKRSKLVAYGFVGLLVLGGMAAGVYFLSANNMRESTPKTVTAPTRASEKEVQKSLLLFDHDSVKDQIADLELDPSFKGRPFLALAQAILNKEFLFDSERALVNLQTAKTLSKDSKFSAEVENLVAFYDVPRDPQSSIESFRKLTAQYPDEPVYKYNLAHSLMFVEKPNEALAALGNSLSDDSALAEDRALLIGWARDSLASAGDSSSRSRADEAFSAALEENPYSAKARLGLAIYRLRRSGLKASEADFRAFIDLAPELDPPTRVVNFRVMRDIQFYIYARKQLSELNIPGGAAGAKPSPLIMAVDAILSCIQNRTGEGEKIVDSALSLAPGDINILKAAGFQRFKEGKFQEMIELLKETRDRNSFAINLMLGKAYSKLGKRDLAAKHYEVLTVAHSNRSEGWSLLGEQLLSANRPDEARINLEKGLKLDNKDLIALRGLVKLNQDKVLTPELVSNLPF